MTLRLSSSCGCANNNGLSLWSIILAKPLWAVGVEVERRRLWQGHHLLHYTSYEQTLLVVVLKSLWSWLQEPGELILRILSVISTLLGHAGDVLKRECSQRWTPECVGLHQSLQAHPVKTHMNGGVSTRTSALRINHRKNRSTSGTFCSMHRCSCSRSPSMPLSGFCTLHQPPGGHLSHPWGLSRRLHGDCR